MSIIIFVAIIASWSGLCDATTYFNYLTSSTKADLTDAVNICATGVQDFRLNSSAGESPSRTIRFRLALDLPTTLPSQKEFRDVAIVSDIRAGCVDAETLQPFPAPEGNLTNKFVVQTARCWTDGNTTLCPRCCEYPTKAAVVSSNGAVGFIWVVEENATKVETLPELEDLCQGYTDLPPSNLSSVYDIDVASVEISASALNLFVGPNVTLVSWIRRFGVLEDIVNWATLLLIATVSMWAAAYNSGLATYSAYQKSYAYRLDHAVRRYLRRRQALRNLEDWTDSPDEEEVEEVAEPRRYSRYEIFGVIFVFAILSSFLILIYFFKSIAIPIFLVLFALSSLSLLTLFGPLLNRLGWCAHRVRLTSYCPYNCVRKCCGCSCPLHHFVACAVFLLIGFAWYVYRHDKIVILTLHNFLGFSLVYHVCNDVRITRFRTCVYACAMLLVYDVFMVFVTPFITKGQSVMESVARGIEGDDMPFVFKIPAIFPSTGNICGQREMAGLLGFGDVVVPAIFGSYMILVGHVVNKPKTYIMTTILSYPFSLVITIISLWTMSSAQPALLYIVPIMFLTTTVTAAIAGDLKTLWKLDMLDYPRSFNYRTVKAAFNASSKHYEDLVTNGEIVSNQRPRGDLRFFESSDSEEDGDRNGNGGAANANPDRSALIENGPEDEQEEAEVAMPAESEAAADTIPVQDAAVALPVNEGIKKD